MVENDGMSLRIARQVVGAWQSLAKLSHRGPSRWIRAKPRTHEGLSPTARLLPSTCRGILTDTLPTVLYTFCLALQPPTSR